MVHTSIERTPVINENAKKKIDVFSLKIFLTLVVYLPEL